jgi:hypothetical protein
VQQADGSDAAPSPVRLHWPRAAARLAALPRLRAPFVRRTTTTTVTTGSVATGSAPVPARRRDGVRISYLFITGSFAALAALLYFWVGMTVFRSMTEPVHIAAERDIVIARPAPASDRPRRLTAEGGMIESSLRARRRRAR